MTSSDSDIECTSEVKTAKCVQTEERYEKAYESFMKWRAKKGIESFSENVFLTYFDELSKDRKSSTLYGMYSMLNTTLSTKHGIRLKDFATLSKFLKSQGNNKTQSSEVFTAEQIQTFLDKAPDEIYLVMKVALILGVGGACQSVDILNLKIQDLEKHGEVILVKLNGKTTKAGRTFVITKREYVQIIEKYQRIRRSDMDTDRFFLNYQNGRCVRQVVGKNKICSIPKRIATYLDLPNPSLYTGHCFRRTSTALSRISRKQVDLTMIKRQEETISDKTKHIGAEPKAKRTKTSSKVTEDINKHPANSLAQPSSSMDDLERSEKCIPTKEDNKIWISPKILETQVYIKQEDPLDFNE